MVPSTGAILSKAAIPSLTVPSVALVARHASCDAQPCGGTDPFPRRHAYIKKCIKIPIGTPLDPPIFCLKSRPPTAAYNHWLNRQ